LISIDKPHAAIKLCNNKAPSQLSDSKSSFPEYLLLEIEVKHMFMIYEMAAGDVLRIYFP